MGRRRVEPRWIVRCLFDDFETEPDITRQGAEHRLQVIEDAGLCPGPHVIEQRQLGATAVRRSPARVNPG